MFARILYKLIFYISFIIKKEVLTCNSNASADHRLRGADCTKVSLKINVDGLQNIEGTNYTFNVGDNITYNCQYHSSGIYTLSVKLITGSELILFPSRRVKSYKISMTMDRFDDGHICCSLFSDGRMNPEDLMKKECITTVENLDGAKTESYYKSRNQSDTCEFKGIWGRKYTHNQGKIRSVNLTSNKDHDLCIYIINIADPRDTYDNAYYERVVMYKHIPILTDTTKASFTTISTTIAEYEDGRNLDDNSSDKSIFWKSGTGVFLLVIVVIIIIIIIRKRQKRRTVTDDLYVTAQEVMYADLQLSPPGPVPASVINSASYVQVIGCVKPKRK